MIKDEFIKRLYEGQAIIEFIDAPLATKKAIEEILYERKAFASPWRDHDITGETYRTITREPLKPGEGVKAHVPVRPYHRSTRRRDSSGR